MKALIWIASILITSIVAVIIKAAGVTLGAIPTMILYAPMFFITPKLCKKWDERKAKKESQKTVLPEYPKNAPSHVLNLDKEADFKERFSKAKAKQSSPIIAVSEKGHTEMMALQRENPKLYDGLSKSKSIIETKEIPVSTSVSSQNKSQVVDDNLQRLIKNKVDSSIANESKKSLPIEKANLHCKKCGAELPEGSLFCNKCGEKIVAKTVHDEQPIYIDSLFSVNKEHLGKYVQLIGLYSWTMIKKEPLKCNLIQYSMRGDMWVDVELTEPLPDYVVNTTVFERQPIIIRGILSETQKPYHGYVLQDAEYQGYWRDETGKVRCRKELCNHECSKDCPIYLNKLGKEKYDEYERDEAIELFKRAVFLAPYYAEPWCNLGYAYLETQKYNESYEAFCESEKFESNNEKTMYGEIIALSKVGRQKEAQDMLVRYRTTYPQKDSTTLSNIISGNLSKAQDVARITDEEYVNLYNEKGRDEFWNVAKKEKERSFATQPCKYTGEHYRKRCEHLNWILGFLTNGKGEELIKMRKVLITDGVKDAKTMLMFDVVDEYDSRHERDHVIF